MTAHPMYLVECLGVKKGYIIKKLMLYKKKYQDIISVSYTHLKLNKRYQIEENFNPRLNILLNFGN